MEKFTCILRFFVHQKKHELKQKQFALKYIAWHSQHEHCLRLKYTICTLLITNYFLFFKIVKKVKVTQSDAVNTDPSLSSIISPTTTTSAN